MAAFVHIHIPSEASFPFYAHGHCVLQLTTSTSQAADSLFKSRHQEFLLQRIAITGTLLPQYMASWWLSLADMSLGWYSRLCSDSQSNILRLKRCFSSIVVCGSIDFTPSDEIFSSLINLSPHLVCVSYGWILSS